MSPPSRCMNGRMRFSAACTGGVVNHRGFSLPSAAPSYYPRDVRPVPGLSEVPLSHEGVEHFLASGGVESPQATRLGGREAEPWHFVVIAVDPVRELPH